MKLLIEVVPKHRHHDIFQWAVMLLDTGRGVTCVGDNVQFIEVVAEGDCIDVPTGLRIAAAEVNAFAERTEMEDE